MHTQAKLKNVENIRSAPLSKLSAAVTESQARKLQKGAKAVIEGLLEELRRNAEAKANAIASDSPKEQKPISTSAVANDKSASADKIADENNKIIVVEAETIVSETPAATAAAPVAASITATTVIDFASKGLPKAELVDNTVTAELIDNTVTPLKPQPILAAHAVTTAAPVAIPVQVSPTTNIAEPTTPAATASHAVSTSTVVQEQVGLQL